MNPTHQAKHPQANNRRLVCVDAPQFLGQSKDGVAKAWPALREAGVLELFARKSLGVVEAAVDAPHATRDPATSPSPRNLEGCVAFNTALVRAVRAHYAAAPLLLTVGGDHSIAAATIAGVMQEAAARGQRVGVIWFDAHTDCNTPETSPSGWIHGMPLAANLGLALPGLTGHSPVVLDPAALTYVGIRSVDPGEQRLLDERRIDAFTSAEIARDGIAPVIAFLRAKYAAYDVVHLSFDIDGIDPSEMPGTGTPAPAGVSLADALVFAEAVGRMPNLRSVDLVEYNPEVERAATAANILRVLDTLLN